MPAKMKLADIDRCFERLSQRQPDPQIELDFTDAYTLLVAVVLDGYLDLVVLVDMVEVVPVILFLIILMEHNPLAAVVVVLTTTVTIGAALVAPGLSW